MFKKGDKVVYISATTYRYKKKYHIQYRGSLYRI